MAVIDLVSRRRRIDCPVNNGGVVSVIIKSKALTLLRAHENLLQVLKRNHVLRLKRRLTVCGSCTDLNAKLFGIWSPIVELKGVCGLFVFLSVGTGLHVATICLTFHSVGFSM